MKSKRKLGVYLILLCLFILYLLKANKMMLYYFDREDTKLETVQINDIPSDSQVYFNVDMNESMGGMLEKVYFQGWAFCETEKDNSNKQINLLFKSVNSDLTYIVKSNAQYRHDVYGVFRESHKIYNELNGVEVQFSTLNMRDGSYELYINVIENDVNYGLINTGLFYSKNRNLFSKELASEEIQ